MKKTTKKQKILIILILIIIIAGISVIATMGFNFDLRYKNTQKVELYLEKEFEISDIKQITDEVMNNQPVIIQKVEVYEDSVSIISTQITDEQKENLITKINEKYGTELTSDGTTVVSIPHTKGRELIKPYITPFAISTIIVLAYIAIRYYKLNSSKVVLKSVIYLALTQVVLINLIAITRIPVGRLTIPMVIIVYMLTLVGLTSKFENELEKKKIENQKN